MKYLVRENNQGEPVGVHNAAGQSAYRNDAGFFSADSQRRIDNKFPGQEWEDFADDQANSFNSLSRWHTQDLPEANINDVLAQLIQKNQPGGEQ